MSLQNEFSEMENNLIDDCYNFIVEHVRKAGDIVRDGFCKLTHEQISSKEYSFELVTEYDKRTEEYLINGILAKYPGHKFVAEESAADDELTDSPTWIIDPIDGTVNYVHGNPNVAISVALAVRKEIVIGIIYNPILEELYRSRKGNGSWLNNRPIKCSLVETLEDAIYSHELVMLVPSWTRDVNLNRILMFATKASTRSMGSAALTLAYVARGAIDAYTVEQLRAWDIAAGDLLIREAGGKVCNLQGGPLNVMHGEIVCAGTPKLCQLLVDGIAECKEWKVVINK